MRRKKDILNPNLAIFKAHKILNIGHFDTRIFEIRSCVLTETIEVLK